MIYHTYDPYNIYIEWKTHSHTAHTMSDIHIKPHMAKVLHISRGAWTLLALRTLLPQPLAERLALATSLLPAVLELHILVGRVGRQGAATTGGRILSRRARRPVGPSISPTVSHKLHASRASAVIRGLAPAHQGQACRQRYGDSSQAGMKGYKSDVINPYKTLPSLPSTIWIKHVKPSQS